jgi:tRNA(adenine34) deaminase
MKSDEYFMKEAIKEAKIALANGDWPIGAVVVLNDEIISRGYNKVYSENNKLAHAEMMALDKAQDVIIANKSKCTVFTTCEPCPMCFGAIILSRIGRLVYGIKENSGCTHLKKHLPPTLQREQFTLDITSGVLADECWQTFISGKPTKILMNDGFLLKDYK